MHNVFPFILFYSIMYDPFCSYTTRYKAENVVRLLIISF